MFDLVISIFGGQDALLILVKENDIIHSCLITCNIFVQFFRGKIIRFMATVGRALANGFPLTEFGGFQGPFSVNSKYFNAFESRLVED